MSVFESEVLCTHYAYSRPVFRSSIAPLVGMYHVLDLPEFIAVPLAFAKFVSGQIDPLAMRIWLS